MPKQFFFVLFVLLTTETGFNKTKEKKIIFLTISQKGILFSL